MPTKPETRQRSVLSGLRTAVVTAACVWSAVWTVGCSPSFFRQPIGDSLKEATAEEIAAEYPPEELRKDLDFLVALHEASCPDPYLRRSREEIQATAERLKASIDRPLRRAEFIPKVMELQAAYAVDHIVQGVPLEDLVAAIGRGERVLPFRAWPTHDGAGRDVLDVVAVAADESGVEIGDRIVRIGDRSAEEFLERLRALVPGESARFQSIRIRESFRSLSWAAGIRPPVSVTLLKPDGSSRTCEVAGVGFNARSNERVAASGTTPGVQGNGILAQGEVLVDAPPFRCLLLEGSVAYIDFPTMNNALAAKWDEFLDSALSAANDREAVGLIVDIRQNGGGDSSLGEALLNRLTDRPYRLAGGLIWRRSEAGYESMRMTVKPHWRWLLPIAMPLLASDYAGLEEGEDVTYGDEPQVHARQKPGFDGPSVLLIGESTFSSAMMLADGVRTYDLMTSIGTPTGGIPTSLGELGFTTLPTSRVVVQFCQKKFLRASGDPNDKGPVVPHIAVEPQPGRDAGLERALDFLRRQPASALAKPAGTDG